jgi:regulator of G-protein signaling
MEELIKAMQHPQNGVPVKTHQIFLATIPCSFSGEDLIAWLTNQLKIDEIGT